MKKVHEELYELLVEQRIGLDKSVSTFSAKELENSMLSIRHHVYHVSTACSATVISNSDAGSATICDLSEEERVEEISSRRQRTKLLRRILERISKICTSCFRVQHDA